MALKKLPDFKTNAGNRLELPSLIDGDSRFYVQNTTEDECRDYAEDLISCGFLKYSERVFSAGDECPYNKNISYAFTSDDTYVFLFWDASLRTVFVKATPPLLLAELDAPKYIKRAAPRFSQLGLKGGGLSDVVSLEDGSFVIVDGGLYTSADEEDLFNFLKSASPCGERPRIALWLITHPHADHLDLAIEFLKNHKNDVTVESFAHQFPNCAPEIIPHDGRQSMALAESFLSVCAECCPDAKHYRVHTGEVFYLAGARLEILSTMDNSFPGLYFSANDISIVSRLVFDTGRTVMLLADATGHITRALAHTYGSYLKSDILQVAHHGLIGGDLGLYKLIDPDICLWPVKEPRFSGTLEGQKYQFCIGEGGLDFNSYIRDESIKHREHYHHGENVTLDMQF